MLIYQMFKFLLSVSLYAWLSSSLSVQRFLRINKRKLYDVVSVLVRLIEFRLSFSLVG